MQNLELWTKDNPPLEVRTFRDICSEYVHVNTKTGQMKERKRRTMFAKQSEKQKGFTKRFNPFETFDKKRPTVQISQIFT